METFEKALTDTIRRIEAGEDLEDALSRHPRHVGELRAHVNLQSSLDPLRSEDPGPEAMAKSLSRLDGVLLDRQKEGGKIQMRELSGIWGAALRVAGGVAIVAALAIGAAFFSGNLHVQIGSSATAVETHPCLDQVLGNLADPPDGHFDVQDILAFRDAFRDQNTDPRYDRDGDGDVDIDDLMAYIQDLRTCLQPAP